MEEDVEEDHLCCRDVLFSNRRKDMLSLVDGAKSFEKRRDIECSFCQGDIRINNLLDVFRVYGNVMSCLVYHASSVVEVDFMAFFKTEKDILRNVLGIEQHGVLDVLKHHEDVSVACAMCGNASRCDLIQCFNENFFERFIKINCEQDVESVTYRYYKLICEKEKSRLSTKNVELLLILLFKRKEFVRFFKVFKASKKTITTFKLALLLSMSSECHVSTGMLLKDYKEAMSFENDGFFDEESVPECLSDIERLVNSKEMDIYVWVEENKKEAYWTECVHAWAVSRKYDVSFVDNSMIELCIEHKRYEDGWLIYKKNSGSSGVNINKICMLCFNGLKEAKEEYWIGRIIEVIENTVESKLPRLVCAISDCVLTKMSEIPSGRRGEVLRKFAEVICCAGNNEETTSSLLYGFLFFCDECEDSEVCGLCADYASKVYRRWKRSKGSFFFSKRGDGQYDAQIYSNMLGLYEATNNCKGFYSVCKDLMKANAGLSKDLHIKLEKLHNQNCKNCTVKNTEMVLSKRGRSSIHHFLEKVVQKT